MLNRCERLAEEYYRVPLAICLRFLRQHSSSSKVQAIHFYPKRHKSVRESQDGYRSNGSLQGVENILLVGAPCLVNIGPSEVKKEICYIQKSMNKFLVKIGKSEKNL